MAVEICMPHMGVSVTEGTVSAWHVAPGDSVAVDEPICDIATDKVDTEVLSTAAGVVDRLLVEVGDTVPVGAPLVALAGDSDPAPAGGAVEPLLVSAPAVVQAGAFDHDSALALVARNGGRHTPPLASPVARRVAGTHGIDLTHIKGTGAAGRIRKSDVLAAIANGDEASTAPAEPPAGADTRSAAASAAPPKPRSGTDTPSPRPTGTGDGALPAGYEDVPHEVVTPTRIRRATAEHMIRSRQTAAHMTTEVDVDMQRVTDARAAVNAERTRGALGKLSYLPFLARATVAALREHPDLNATFELERNLRWQEVNLGIAVDTPQGLLVPVIRRCEALTVDAIGERIMDLAERARARRLTADDLRAGTFTISNPGSVGAVSAPAIINQPQVAILGVPKIVRKPWVVALPDGTETIAIRPILRLALTFDHRAVDGADATRALVQIGANLEAWDAQSYR